ncbi:MAG TPA: SDR family oxidoreductase, partial [Vicinamibacteria bacterium]|nr:SDR family oxidoreductase [Vicinamibacteria bacterium]
AVVTGANRGLGLETCRQLLARGMHVAMAARDADATERARRSLGPDSERAMAVHMDVTDVSTIAAAHRRIVEQMGAPGVLVNNAAVLLFDDADPLSIPPEAYRETFETNVFGVIEVCRVFVPPMAKRKYGRIVNVSSGAGQLSKMSTYAPAYSISKAALNAFTRLLAATYRGQGVLANAVDPGWVRTDMGGPSAPRSVEEGVETTVWLATLPDDGPTGGFFRDKRAIDW